jgi:predicted metal-dependent phosphoesterase TrpH
MAPKEAESGSRMIHVVRGDDHGRIKSVELKSLPENLTHGFDGHVHTSASWDASREPKDLAYEVHQNGYHVVVTDHRTLYGAVLSISELAALKASSGESDSSIVAGVELNAKVAVSGHPGLQRMHVLGVAIDVESPSLLPWLRHEGAEHKPPPELLMSAAPAKEHVTAESDPRLEEVIKAVRELEAEGFVLRKRKFSAGGGVDELTEEKVHQSLYSGTGPYRMIASYMLDEGNLALAAERFGIRTHDGARPKIANELKIELDLALQERFGKYELARRGGEQADMPRPRRPRGPAQSPRKVNLPQITAAVKEAGGLAIAAHLALSYNRLNRMGDGEMAEFFMQLKGQGIDGVEAYMPEHRRETADRMAKAALSCGMLVFGGSDSHRAEEKIGHLSRGM